MDEEGQSGDAGAAEGGVGADPHDRAARTGWASSGSPWSSTGAAPDSMTDVPSWRRPATELPSYPHDRPTGEVRPVPDSPFPGSWSTGDVRAFRARPPDGFRPLPQASPSGSAPSAQPDPPPTAGPGRSIDTDPMTQSAPSEGPPPPAGTAAAPRWSDSRSRYADLLAHLSPNGAGVNGAGLNGAAVNGSRAEHLARNGNVPADAVRPGTQPTDPVPTGPRPADQASTGTVPSGFDDTRGDSSGDPGSVPSGARPAGAGPQRTSEQGLIEGQMGEPPRLADPLDPDTDVRASDVRAADLRAADLRAADLRAADLRKAELRDAGARTADLPVNADQRAAVPMIRPAAFPDRPAFPAVRPSTPGGRPIDQAATESARHALDRDTPPSGTPQVTKAEPPAGQRPPGPPEPARPVPSYDSSTFPRRLPYEAPPARPPIATPPPPPSHQPAAPGDPVTGYSPAAPYADRSARDPGTGRMGERLPRALPQRVPGRPDVPTVPEPPSVEPTAETPALARIATHLRRGDVLPPQDRQEGFDVQAILAAVREVDGVRGASLRATPAGAHSLRLDLAEGADPAEVSRRVARLLQDTMGLDAAMQTPETLLPPPAPARPGAAYVPSQPVPAGRAPVSGAGSMVDAPTTAAPGEATPARATTSGAVAGEQSRRLPQAGRGRATVDTSRARSMGEVTGSPIAAPGIVDRTPGVEPSPPRPLYPGDQPGPRVVIENVRVNTFGTDATVEVRLTVGERTASGEASGPAVDGYLLRLCAMATARAVDELLAESDHVDGPARCYVEHAAAVPFGSCEVAVVVLLLSCGGWVEQLAGSAVVTGDDRHAMVRATLAAVNRRLEALLS